MNNSQVSLQAKANPADKRIHYSEQYRPLSVLSAVRPDPVRFISEPTPSWSWVDSLLIALLLTTWIIVPMLILLNVY